MISEFVTLIIDELSERDWDAEVTQSGGSYSAHAVQIDRGDPVGLPVEVTGYQSPVEALAALVVAITHRS